MLITQLCWGETEKDLQETLNKVNDEGKQYGMKISIKGELKPEISLLDMKVLTLIKAKSNVFL